MRFPALCAVCSDGHAAHEPQLIPGQLDASGVVYVDCPGGHGTAVVFRERRHEVLLRSGGTALLAGCTTEAICSLSAALERACEFYIRVVCRADGLGQEQVDLAWDGIRADSSRQLGAFCMLFLLDTGTPLSPDPRMTSLRDRVFHQGRGFRRSGPLGPLAARPVAGSLPSGPMESVRQSRRIANERDAREFGEYVFSRIRAIDRALERHPGEVAAEGRRELEMQLNSIPSGIMCVTVLDRSGCPAP